MERNGVRLAHDTWVVIADGEKYLLLRNEGNVEDPNLGAVLKEEVENPPARELSSDRPGRMRDAGPGKSALQQTDWHRLSERRFAEDLAALLVDWASQGRFRRLVVVADPCTLGALRAAYGDRLQSVLAAEIGKDLTNVPIGEIEGLLNSA